MANLVANGDFATGDFTGWGVVEQGIAPAAFVSNQAAHLPRVDGSNLKRIDQFVAGGIETLTYLLSFANVADPEIVNLLGAQLGTSQGGSQVGANIDASAGEIQTFNFIMPAGGSVWLRISPETSGQTGVFDNVSIELVGAELTSVTATGAVGNVLVWEPAPEGPSGNWTPVITS